MAKIDKFVSLAEVAEQVGASRGTVRKWLEEDGVAAVVLGAGTLRYRAWRRTDPGRLRRTPR